MPTLAANHFGRIAKRWRRSFMAVFLVAAVGGIAVLGIIEAAGVPIINQYNTPPDRIRQSVDTGAALIIFCLAVATLTTWHSALFPHSWIASMVAATLSFMFWLAVAAVLALFLGDRFGPGVPLFLEILLYVPGIILAAVCLVTTGLQRRTSPQG